MIKIQRYAAGNKLSFCILIFMVLLCTACEKYPMKASIDPGELAGEYCGEPFPGPIPLRFCPDFFSEELHTPPIFSPNGSELYFKPMSSVGYAKIFMMKMVEGKWTEPYYASFNFNAINDSPFITRDGERLYFLSDEDATYKDYNKSIYFVSRYGDDWSDPVMISDNVNDFLLHWQFSVSDNYNLYFQDASSCDLYYSAFVGGEYQAAEKLPECINSPTLLEGSPFIAHDETYLIFDRRREGYSDLMISFKGEDQQWTEPIALDSHINTSDHELYPYITADDKFMFFLRMTNEGSFPFWVDASFIEELRP